MKRKLVSVLLAAVMTVSSVSVASATSMDPVAESFDNEELTTETENETETELQETETQESESSVESVPDTGDDVVQQALRTTLYLIQMLHRLNLKHSLQKILKRMLL